MRARLAPFGLLGLLVVEAAAWALSDHRPLVLRREEDHLGM